jgi:hypothetical protein
MTESSAWGLEPEGRAGAEAALALFEPFARRLLPGALRRLARRRGYTEARRVDLLADVKQELRLDCVEHAGLIVQLSAQERHQRWFRIAERWVYRQRLRVDRVGEGRPAREPSASALPPDAAALAPTLADALPALPSRLLHALAHAARQHRNGRANVAATAAPLGLHPRRVRQLWEEAAARLGYGDEYLQFWRQRLGEALTGLAADLLRDRGQCLLLAGPRNRPDPAGRLRRIRRIHGQLMVRPLPPDLRRALSPSLRRGGAHVLDPRALLSHAAALQPDSPTVWSWSFEDAVARGDLRAAAADVRRARGCGGDAVSQTLARARLLEARGRIGAATALLGRALARHGGADAVRLRLALAAAAQRPSTGGGDNATAST